MKKLLCLSLLSAILLVACGDDSRKETESNTKKAETVIAEETESNNDIDFKTIITDNLREGDEVTHFSNEGDEIKATIKLAENDLTEQQLLAETTYAGVGEDLLAIEEGWNTLTINFENVGEISFNRDEAKENEYGAYFENEEIINRLSQQ